MRTSAHFGWPIEAQGDTRRDYPTRIDGPRTDAIDAKVYEVSRLRRMLGFAENLTANTAASTSTPVDIPGVSVTFTLTATTMVACTLNAIGLNASVANQVAPAVQCAGLSGNYPRVTAGILVSTGGAGQAFLSSVFYVTLTAGTYTVKAQALNRGPSGTATVVGAQLFLETIGA